MESVSLQEKIKVFESLNINDSAYFLENAKKGAFVIREIKISRDEKYAFICKSY